MTNKTILCISSFYHDSAICMINDNTVVACLQEERFSRIKHDSSFPLKALEKLYKNFGLNNEDISDIVFYDKPILKMERILKNLIAISPKGFKFALDSIPLTINKKIFVSEHIRRYIKGDYSISYIPHHVSHASASFIPSGYSDAAFMINDGVGEWDTSTFGTCDDNGINILGSIEYPHSLGMMYSALTYFCGFRVNSGEYKLMGLAPYGNPQYTEKMMTEMIDLKNDGSYRLNMKYFSYQYGQRMCGEEMERLLGIQLRKPEDELTYVYADIAASIQQVLEIILIRMAKHIQKETAAENLVMGGGVALNCKANSKIIENCQYKNVFIQPAAGDAGGALGAALYSAKYIKKIKLQSIQNYSYLGTEYSDDQIESYLMNRFSYSKIDDPSKDAAYLISEGNVVGWFQGRMEYGPRALGSRSILGDPRDPKMQKRMNLKIKFRESFRPFAPSVMEDYAADYFIGNYHTPYMLTVAKLREEKKIMKDQITHDFNILSKGISQIPAVIHADFTSRLQTVNKEQNPKYYKLIDYFRQITGVPLVINTSFNVRGQPIVESPKDALSVFLNTEMDYLIIGNFILKKDDNNKIKEEYAIEKLIED